MHPFLALKKECRLAVRELLVLILIAEPKLESRTGGSRTAERHTFAQAAKVRKSAGLLAEGIFLCMVSVVSIGFWGWDPALFRGPLFCAFLWRKDNQHRLFDVLLRERTSRASVPARDR